METYTRYCLLLTVNCRYLPTGLCKPNSNFKKSKYDVSKFEVDRTTRKVHTSSESEVFKSHCVPLCSICIENSKFYRYLADFACGVI